MKNFLRTCMLAACCFALGAEAYAQATIRGKVVNGTTGEALLGATVRIMSGSAVKGGAYTDLEGNYTAKVAPGTYDVIISYISFISDTLKGVVANAGEVAYNETLLVEELAVREDLAVEITATRSTTSTVTLYNQKRNAINAIDGVSFDLIQRTGDNSAAAAMQRVVGVTVEGGKYVYVRGLGDRYSKTTLNGAEIPSLDPNRNSVQMDIFPSNLIDNIIVYKNFTPDLPGNFTGGLVDVRTKDFPDRFMLNFSAGLAYNPQANLLEGEFLTYETGKRDWLAYDDGTRAIPDAIQRNNFTIPSIPSTTDPQQDAVTAQVDEIARSFDTGFGPRPGNSGLDQNYQISVGNQLSLFGKPLGFIASLSYRSEYTAYDNGIVGRYTNPSNALSGNIAERLTPQLVLNSIYGARDVLLGGLVKVSYKPHTNHKLSFNYMRNQSGSSTANSLEGPFPREDEGLFLQARVVGYLQRALSVSQFQGGHRFGKLKADWIVSLSRSAQDEPDLRFFTNDYIVEENERFYDIQINAYPAPSRFFRELDETNFDANLHLELPFKNWAGDGKIKFGGTYTVKDREFAERRYQLFFGDRAPGLEGDLDAFTAPANFGVLDTTRFGSTTRYSYGLYFQDASEDRNFYTGTQAVSAAYAMTELPLIAKLRLIAGARFERTDATTQAQDGTAPGALDLSDILPAASLIYKPLDNMNIRGGYSRTLARPTFREFSPFVSFDFAADFLLVGNPNLQRTLIDNYDLRWEWFMTPAELFSVSLFYKNFTNPIERVLDLRAQNPEFNFRNVDNGVAYGVELEFKKNFAFISEGLRKLELGGNLSLIQSEIDIDSAEYEGIIAVDPTRPPRRPMFGQSPYAANAELVYSDQEKLGLQVSVSYNVFGPRISVVAGADPDIYEMPRGLLNFNISKNLGRYLSLRFRASNLLNPAYRQVYRYKDQEFVFGNYTLGRSYSLTLSVKI